MVDSTHTKYALNLKAISQLRLVISSQTKYKVDECSIKVFLYIHNMKLFSRELTITILA